MTKTEKPVIASISQNDSDFCAAEIKNYTEIF